MNIDTDIRYLKGVGQVRAENLYKMGIYNVYDLISHYPRDYENRQSIKEVKDFINGEYTLFFATICSIVSVRYIRKNLSIYSCFALDNNSNTIKLVWFNQKFIKTRVKQGVKYLFYGKTELNGKIYEVNSPNIYNLNQVQDIKGIYPVYPLTYGISNNYIYTLIKQVFSETIHLEEVFSDNFRSKYNLLNIDEAIKKIHFPNSYEDVKKSRNRFIFEELFFLQLALRTLRKTNNVKKKENVFNDLDTLKFEEMLPYTLTNAQKRVLCEIKEDLKSDHVMNRMVQGDVGSGKTVVAALACYMAVKNGYQAAIMAPTAILATQHYQELKQYFEQLGINVTLITSGNTKKQKEDIINRLKNGKIDILIGTHSIIEENIIFKNLALVVTDEQHRFGVNQRIKLTSKGKSVETLVMSATPIPRSLAIILYGDLDISIIDELPKGRIKIKTCIATASQEERVNNFIKSQINNGRQVYVVCPLVEDSEKLNLNSVESVYQKYKNEFFDKYRVDYIHGKMTQSNKDEIMQRFKEGSIDILISTSVIEVGISVKNASVMIIEDADRFGLASLHQLRGRVGRGSYESFCVLKTNNNSQNSRQRLKIMENSSNGFEIAQKDLELRGPGDFFGFRQSGLPEFKIADLIKDMEILKLSKVAVDEILKSDLDLINNDNVKIKNKLLKMYSYISDNLGM